MTKGQVNRLPKFYSMVEGEPERTGKVRFCVLLQQNVGRTYFYVGNGRLFTGVFVVFQNRADKGERPLAMANDYPRGSESSSKEQQHQGRKSEFAIAGHVTFSNYLSSGLKSMHSALYSLRF